MSGRTVCFIFHFILSQKQQHGSYSFSFPPPFPLHFLNNLKVGHGRSLMYMHTLLFPSKPEQKCHTTCSVGEIKEGEHTAADWFISFTPGLRGSAWLGEGCWGDGVFGSGDAAASLLLSPLFTSVGSTSLNSGQTEP